LSADAIDANEMRRHPQSRTLGALAAFYGLSYAASGVLFPFLPLLLHGRAFTATEIAWVMAMNPIGNLIAPPIWSWIADTFQLRIALLRTVSFCSGVTVLLLIPEWGLAGAVASMALWCFFRTPIVSLIDATTHATLGPGRLHLYAPIRAIGSLGFALAAGLSGLLDSGKHSHWLLVIVAGCFFASLIPSFAIETSPVVHRRAVLGHARAFIREARLTRLFVANGLYYAAHAVFDTYFGLFLERLGHRNLVGPAWMFAVMCEVALLFLAPFILRNRDPLKIVAVIAGVATVRWLLISIVRDPTALVMVQVLHGLTFGLWYAGLVRYVQARSPEEVRTSVQAALLASMGLGTVFGNIFGGKILDSWGGPALFQTAAVFSAAAFVLYVRVVRTARSDAKS
jgi:predicted MFS family arabinose efflux permease